jgi:hypothetical protein
VGVIGFGFGGAGLWEVVGVVFKLLLFSVFQLVEDVVFLLVQLVENLLEFVLKGANYFVPLLGDCGLHEICLEFCETTLFGLRQYPHFNYILVGFKLVDLVALVGCKFSELVQYSITLIA